MKSQGVEEKTDGTRVHKSQNSERREFERGKEKKTIEEREHKTNSANFPLRRPRRASRGRDSSNQCERRDPHTGYLRTEIREPIAYRYTKYKLGGKKGEEAF